MLICIIHVLLITVDANLYALYMMYSVFFAPCSAIHSHSVLPMTIATIELVTSDMVMW